MRGSTMLLSSLASALLALVVVCAGCAKKAEGEGKIPITTSSEEARNDFLHGRELAEKLLLQNSIQYFQSAISKDPNFAQAYFNLAQSAVTAKDFFENIKKAAALAAGVTEGERLMILGFEAGANGDPAKQKDNYEQLVAKFPGDERAHFLLGNYYFGQQEYAPAVDHYTKATVIDSNYSPAYNSLGYAYRAMEKFDDAERAFKKYTELIPNDPNPYDSYAELLMKMGRFDESITYYEKALAQDPNFVSSHLGIEANLMFKGNPGEAEARLQKLYDIARNEGERRAALFARTVLYVDGGKLDSALHEMDKQYQMAESVSDVAQMSADLTAKGNIFVELGKYDDAAAMFEKSKRMIEESDRPQKVKDNTLLNNHYVVGIVAVKKKDLTTARSEAEKLLRGAGAVRNGALVRLAHELAGIIALGDKKYDLAISELQQASQLNPYNLYRISLAYAGKGDKVHAKDFCARAAHDNTLPTLNYAFIRAKAEKQLATM